MFSVHSKQRKKTCCIHLDQVNLTRVWLLRWFFCFTLHIFRSLHSELEFLSFLILVTTSKSILSAVIKPPKLTDHSQREAFWRISGPRVLNGPFFQFTASCDVKDSKWKDVLSDLSGNMWTWMCFLAPPVCSCDLATCSRTHWVGVIGALNVPARVALSRVSARHTFVKYKASWRWQRGRGADAMYCHGNKSFWTSAVVHKGRVTTSGRTDCTLMRS